MAEPTPAPVTFEQAVHEFLSWHRGNTNASYGDDLRILGRWCDETGKDPLALRRADIEAFLVYCEDVRGNKIRTIKRRLSTLKCFYAIMADDEVIQRSPAQVALQRSSQTTAVVVTTGRG